LEVKAAQGERNGKGRSEDCSFSLPSRCLPYAKVVQDVYKKRKSEGFSARFAGFAAFPPYFLSVFVLYMLCDLFKNSLSFHLESSNQTIP